MRKNKQSARSLTAFLVTWSFIVLTVTGLMLYVVPQGRIANWVNWSFMGMSKDQWTWVHMMFGGVLVVTGVLHLYYNWKPFKKYFADRVKGHFEIKREIIYATGITVFIFAFSAANIAPASWIIDLNGWIKDSWITSPELEPPYGHAEEASLAGLSRKMNFDLKQVMAGLEAEGVDFDNQKDTLDQIALKNQTTPMAIYQIVRRYEIEQAPVDTGDLTAVEIEAMLSGTGLGRKSIRLFCEENGIDMPGALERLAGTGIQASAESILKELADDHEKTPIDLAYIIMLP